MGRLSSCFACSSLRWFPPQRCGRMIDRVPMGLCSALPSFTSVLSFCFFASHCPQGLLLLGSSCSCSLCMVQNSPGSCLCGSQLPSGEFQGVLVTLPEDSRPALCSTVSVPKLSALRYTHLPCWPSCRLHQASPIVYLSISLHLQLVSHFLF